MTEATPEERRRMLLEAYGWKKKERAELEDDDLTVSRLMREMGWSEKMAGEKLKKLVEMGVVRRIDRRGYAETIYRPTK